MSLNQDRSLGVKDASPKPKPRTRTSLSGTSNARTVLNLLARMWAKSEPKPRRSGGSFATSTGLLGHHGRLYPPHINSNSTSRSRPNTQSFDYAKTTTRLSPSPSLIILTGTPFNTHLLVPIPSPLKPGSDLEQQVPRSPARVDDQRR